MSRSDELVLTLFIPAEDPMPFPQGFIIRAFNRLDRAAVQSLKESAIDFDLIPVEAGFDTETPRFKDVTDWSDKALLSTSIMIHKVTGNVFARSGLDVLAMTSKAAMRRGATLNVDDLNILSMPPSITEDMRETLEGSRAGHTTVFEVAVHLRVFGDFPVEDHWEVGTIFPPRLEPLTEWEPIDCTSGNLPSKQIFMLRVYDALDVALSDIRVLQEAIYAVTKETLRPLQRQLLPPFIPCAVRRFDNFGPINPSPIEGFQGWLQTGSDGSRFFGPDDLTDEVLRQVVAARFDRQEAFFAHSDLRRQALYSLERHGDTRQAALMAGLSAEALLDELLLHLQWEEGLTPESAVDRWRAGLDNRVRSDYHKRIGGSWSTSGSGVLSRWSTYVADLRHRVVHGTYLPTEGEARRAISTVDEMVSHLCDRLADHAVLRRYPRTAVALAGEPGLRKRNAVTKRVKNLMLDPTEPNWDSTYARWREVHRRRRRDQSAKRAPDSSTSLLYYILDADGSGYWCLRHAETAMASAVDPIFSDADYVADQIAIARSRLADEFTTRLPYVMEFDRKMLSTQPEANDWKEEYHLVPTLNVLLKPTS